MSPNEFLIAFSGFRALIGDEAPSPEQWARICEFHTEAVGYEVKAKWARDEQKQRMALQLADQEAVMQKQMQAFKGLLYQPNAAYGPLSGGGSVGTTTVTSTFNPSAYGSGTTIVKI